MDRTRRTGRRTTRLAIAAVAAGTLTAAFAGPANAHTRSSFIGNLHTVDPIASTVPANGDVNPYGTAVIPADVGALYRGDVLVSNFNNVQNLQGTGTTIVQVTPSGGVSTFATIDQNLAGCPGGVGLTTALSVLRDGWVVVGSLPTTDGTSATATSPGCLIVLDSHGKVRKTITGHGINGPWDMTVLDFGGVSELFVSNVLNGTVANSPNTVDQGTVVRLTLASGPDSPPRVLDSTVIASGLPERTDPAALVVGPTGVGLAPDGTLYVADTVGNRIAAIPGAPWRHSDDGAGRTVTSGGALNGPLGLVVAPDGNVLTVNAGDGNIVETTPQGDQVAQRTLDDTNGGGGSLFGLAVVPGRDAVYFVDDDENQLNLLTGP